MPEPLDDNQSDPANRLFRSKLLEIVQFPVKGRQVEPASHRGPISRHQLFSSDSKVHPGFNTAQSYSFENRRGHLPFFDLCTQVDSPQTRDIKLPGPGIVAHRIKVLK